MSKEHVSARVPENLRDDIDRVCEQEGIEQSEAIRQTLRRGLDTYDGSPTPGETLGRQSTSVAAVGTVAAGIGAVLGQPWATSLVVPFGLTTFAMAILWASVRTLAGRDLV